MSVSHRPLSFVLLVALATGACAGDEPSLDAVASLRSDLVGTWHYQTDEEDSILEFYSDGTYAYPYVGEGGFWDLDGDELTMFADNGYEKRSRAYVSEDGQFLAPDVIRRLGDDADTFFDGPIGEWASESFIVYADGDAFHSTLDLTFDDGDPESMIDDEGPATYHFRTCDATRCDDDFFEGSWTSEGYETGVGYFNLTLERTESTMSPGGIGDVYDVPVYAIDDLVMSQRAYYRLD